ncbi:glycosyl transferase [Acinetobacter sp. WCHAc010034]|uniref:glycosyltransferase family 25 protein n=1 Tax=Acinetobacter sp. WCHAc010034 TaxID=1879049 RepID=UPI00083A2305|nr:glycosyltransferase family 25 protein [Acinetobacter sp. WCHAc010034]AYA03767.1 glycosyl transferase [Acinetobacter sp. WCHAc010034]
MKIFVISIEEENSLRLNNFTAQPFFQQGAAPFAKVGVKGSELPVKQYFEIAVKGRSQPLSPSELGCSLSHMAALKAFLETDDDYALILEDDALFPHALTLAQIEAEIEKADFPPNILLSLGGIQMKESLKVRGKIRAQKFLNKNVLEVTPHYYHRVCAAFAYIVDRKMANTLLKYNARIRKADDWGYLYDFDSTAHILMTHIIEHPPLAVGETDEAISKIENERVNTADLPVSSYGKFWPKNLIKLVTSRYKNN